MILDCYLALFFHFPIFLICLHLFDTFGQLEYNPVCMDLSPKHLLTYFPHFREKPNHILGRCLLIPSKSQFFGRTAPIPAPPHHPTRLPLLLGFLSATIIIYCNKQFITVYILSTSTIKGPHKFKTRLYN